MTTLPPESNDASAENGASEQPAPEAQPAAPQYEAPPAAAGGYQQPQAAADPTSNITLNYWLSVFFGAIPALIFWLIEKDKADARALKLHVDNLNFSLLRLGVSIAGSILVAIPAIGWLIALLLWIALVVMFVFHIMAATKAANYYRSGDTSDPFMFNYAIIK